jgi:pimeloyl-ACP methyl ester carboxylesterase
MKLVLLPGLHGTEKLFAPLIDQLPSAIETQIICYPNDLKLDYRQLQNLIVGQLPDQDYVLLAESFSGPLAYWLALTQAVNLKAIIFVASFLENPRPWLLNSISLKFVHLMLKLPIPAYVIKKWLIGPKVDESIISMCQQTLAKIVPDLLAFRLSEISMLSKQHELCNIKAYYIQATNDKLVPSNAIEAFKNVFADLEIIAINSGHFVLQAQPTASAQTIIQTIAIETPEDLNRLNEVGL